MKARLWLSQEQVMIPEEQIVAIHEQAGQVISVTVTDDTHTTHTVLLDDTIILLPATGIQEHYPDMNATEPKMIFQGDIVQVRQIEERLNCGGLNTPENIGQVVFYEGSWQVRTNVGPDLSYLNIENFYVDLNDEGNYRRILCNIYEDDLATMEISEKTRLETERPSPFL